MVNYHLWRISCGIPQGLCLGPLLLLLFINDMPYLLTKVKISVYTGDPSLTHSDVKLDNVAEVIKSELGKLRKWLQGNKLSLNIEMTISVEILEHQSARDTRFPHARYDVAFLLYSIQKRLIFLIKNQIQFSNDHKKSHNDTTGVYE